MAICVAVALACITRTVSLAEPGDQHAPPITLEDLQDALDRGDLSQSEFDLVAEMIQERLRSDSLELARVSQRILQATSPGHSSLGPPKHGRIRYSTYAPIRGSGSTGQYVQVEPSFGAGSAQVFARRAGSDPWYVSRATIQAKAGPLEFQGGSLDLNWTGGLVIGSSPVLTRHFASGLAGLWHPDRSRLWGVSARATGGRFDAEVTGSSVWDSLWRHRALGGRIKVRLGRFAIEPALIGQELEYGVHHGSFSSLVSGLSVESKAGSHSFRVNSAVTSRSLALQTLAAGKAAARTRWECEYWTIPAGFRNPLLHARGEYDREPVEYPELGTRLLNASTGESGGRLSMRIGGSRNFGGVGASVWREQRFRPASVRLTAVVQTADVTRMLRLEYSHSSRPVDGLREIRHETGLFTSYRAVFAQALGRWTWGTGLPLGAAGGRLAGGVRVHTASAGVWEVKAAWDAYDLSLASGQFVTLRVDQSLPFRRGEFAVHLRWRSSYAARAATLSVRIDSSVYL